MNNSYAQIRAILAEAAELHRQACAIPYPAFTPKADHRMERIEGRIQAIVAAVRARKAVNPRRSKRRRSC